MFWRPQGKARPVLTVTIEVEHDTGGKYVAYVREVPGVVTQGSTEHQAVGALTFALEQHMSATIQRVRDQLLSEIGRANDSHSAPTGEKDHYEVALA
jgi:predicted RNase H-like HicB family nuclease